MPEPVAEPKPTTPRPNGPIPMPAGEPTTKAKPDGPIPMPADEPAK
jgi:hypothetical protein